MSGRTEPPSTRLDDGRWQHKFSQTLIKRFMMCPEQARLDLAGELERRETDAACLGTAFHTGVEILLRGGSEAEARNGSAEHFDRMVADGLEWVQIAKPATAHRYIQNAITGWLETVLPQLSHHPEAEIEERFKVPIWSDDHRVIFLTGTPDYWEPDTGVWDWKTANRNYEHWEVDRFYIQPTAYAYAVAVKHEIVDPIDFTFAVSLKGKNPKMQLVETTRHGGHYDWLSRQALSIARMIEADLEGWPLNDQGWHCSAKWCTAWDRCKGAHV